MNTLKTCNSCKHLIKNYTDESHVPFAALCSKTRESNDKISATSVIAYKTGPMLDIQTPSWCPLNMEEKTIIKQFKDLTYAEKNDFFKSLPRHTTWDDVKENEYYVLPKTHYSSGKIYKVTSKTQYLIHLSEVNENLCVVSGSKNIYPNDVELSFLVEYHKFK